MVNPPSSRSGNMEFGGLRRGRAALEPTRGRQKCDPIKRSRVHNTKQNTSRGSPRHTKRLTTTTSVWGSNFSVGRFLESGHSARTAALPWPTLADCLQHLVPAWGGD